MTRFEDLSNELEMLGRAGRLRQLVARRLEATSIDDGHGKTLVNFGSNDYLGYATEPVVDSSAAIGSSASALVTGWSDRHEQLAQNLATFESTQAAVLFPSGYAACSGAVATLARPGDLIISDALNHASLIDGCRLSAAKRIVYPHGDVNFVEDTLRDHRGQFNRVWLLTESVFSMDGDIAPLVDLCEVAEKYGAELMVDEAHATGVLGPTGSGVCEALGIRHRVAVRIGTMSKALGAQGGFVAADQVVVDYLVNRCRSLIYSTMLSPSIVAAVTKRLQEIRDNSSRRDSLIQRITQLHVLRKAEPAKLLTPIIPILIGSCHQTLDWSARLRELGFFVPAIRPPTVPEGTSRLRISLSACHTEEQVANLCTSLQTIADDRPS